MAYEIDETGAVALGQHRLPVPATVSAEARAMLAVSPWAGVELPPPPRALWAARDRVDAGFKAGNEIARRLYPVDVQEMAFDGVPCHLIRPLDPGADDRGRVLINLHGGGFVLGSGQLIEAIPMCHMTRANVVAVDYRLAPEHPYPAAVDDALAVYRTLLKHHPAQQVGIFGASAGGFLTAQTLARIIAEGLPLPACAGVFTAGGDLSDFGDTAGLFTLSGFWGELILPFDHALSEIGAYVGGADPADPLVSPIRGDLSRFPPTLLVSGTRDALLSPTCQFHRALRRAGVEADLFVYEAMPHAHWMALHLPETRETLEVMAGFFNERLVRKSALPAA
jgi:monoterpene epsilon-lactone hydrolase